MKTIELQCHDPKEAFPENACNVLVKCKGDSDIFTTWYQDQSFDYGEIPIEMVEWWAYNKFV